MYKLFISVICILLVGCSSISQNAQSKYQQAVQEWEKGNYSEPIFLLEAAVTDSPRFLDAHLKLAEYKIHSSQAQGAMENIDKAIELDESRAQSYILRGQALTQLGESLKAQSQYNKASSLTPSSEQKFEIYMGKAVAKINLGLHEDAQEYIDQANSISPKNDRITYLNALLREKKMGPNSATIKDYKVVLANNPNDTQVLKSMGDTWKQLEVSQKAIKYYKQYLESGGKSAEVKKYLDKQIQIRKQRLAEKRKLANETEQAKIELEKIKADVEKEKARAQLEAQKAIAEAEARKAEADAEAQKAIADAEVEKARAEAEAERAKVEAENAKYLNDPLLKEDVEEAKVLTCPVCGRIYKGNQKTCDYDGTPLIDLTEE